MYVVCVCVNLMQAANLKKITTIKIKQQKLHWKENIFKDKCKKTTRIQ